ncbi:MAG: hypothetical protein NVS3B2_15840 [Ramlibacter sp.]
MPIVALQLQHDLLSDLLAQIRKPRVWRNSSTRMPILPAAVVLALASVGTATSFFRSLTQ